MSAPRLNPYRESARCSLCADEANTFIGDEAAPVARFCVYHAKVFTRANCVARGRMIERAEIASRFGGDGGKAGKK